MPISSALATPFTPAICGAQAIVVPWPPISDTVPGYDLRPWWGLAGPAGLPQNVIDRLYKATMTILDDPATQKRFIELGLIITPMNTKDFNAFTVTELAKWTKIVKDSGATAN